MQIAKISLFDKICITGGRGPMQIAKKCLFLTKYALLMGRDLKNEGSF